MAQTYAKLQKQIEVLKRQAEAIRLTEVQGVVDRIKVAIAHYDLTPEHLFGRATPTSKTKAANRSSRKVGSNAKYADAAGNKWGGRGPRPRWLRDAVGGGAKAEDFLSTSAQSGEDGPMSIESPGTASGKTKRASLPARYADDAGNTWAGRGPRPGWLKAAIAAGKELNDFLK